MKYIIMDLDDTLLNDKKKITKYSMDILNKLRALGYLIVLNTARSYLSALPYALELEPDYLILNGGVEILDKDFNIIFKDVIAIEESNLILNEIKNDPMVMRFSIQAETGLYSKDLDFVASNGIALYNSFKDDITEGCYKIMLATTEQLKYKRLAHKLNLVFESYLGGMWCRLSKGSKYMGNKVLFKYLKDNSPMDYTFGDDSGDKEMIDKAYHGVYLANSRLEIRSENANVTLNDSNNDGVCRYLARLLLGGTE